jgi:hypothetical protein
MAQYGYAIMVKSIDVGNVGNIASNEGDATNSAEGTLGFNIPSQIKNFLILRS